ncbi:MAG: DUF4175 domain-containing protein [Acidobacteria bacterium]|nr:DUF4175 domain-containing protein [Acidobacteriota bacterium]
MPRLPETAAGVDVVNDDRSVVSRFLVRTQRRLRIASIYDGIAAGSASAAAAMVAARATRMSELSLGITAFSIGTVVAAVVVAVGMRQWSRTRTALFVETRSGSLDNLLITAEELPRHSPPVHPLIAREIVGQVAIRLAPLRSETIVPLARPAILAGAFCGCLALVATTGDIASERRQTAGDPVPSHTHEPEGIESVAVRVSPPAYTGLPQRTVADASAVHVLEGSRIDVEVMADAAGVDLVRPDGRATRMDGDERQHRAGFVAAETEFLVLRPLTAPSAGSRLLSIIVDPDRRPSVHVRAPARDLAFATPDGRIPLALEASDDVALDSLEIRYTRTTGSGEAFTFNEGTLPLAVARASRAQWTATSELLLSTLGLEVGDTLVYRAVARDGKPGADPASSESYIVEIGQLQGVVSSGFALPDDKDRHAISQQMIIIKTERLNAARADLDEKAVAEQSSGRRAVRERRPGGAAVRTARDVSGRSGTERRRHGCGVDLRTCSTCRAAACLRSTALLVAYASGACPDRSGPAVERRASRRSLLEPGGSDPEDLRCRRSNERRDASAGGGRTVDD